MSGEALKEEIRRTSEEKARQALADARAKADSIVAEAEREAKSILERRVADAKRLAEQIEASEAAKARMECARSLLGVQSKYVEEAFREAESSVVRVPEADPSLYEAVLSGYIGEALGKMEGPRLVAVVREQDRRTAEKIVSNLAGGRLEAGGAVSISSEPLRSAGGVVVHTDDARVYYVSTFESKLLKARDELRAKVVEALVGRA